jgi:AraC family transcriptional regulator
VKSTRTVTLQDYKKRVLSVLVHIQEHLDEELPLEELARRACFSPFHFHRIFRGMVGESVKDYVRRLRLERAASRLKLGTAPVTSIALDAGYDSHEAFTRAFGAAFGRPPSAYRVAKGVKLLKAAPSGLHFRNGKPPVTFRTLDRGALKMKVEIKHLEPMRVAFMRHVGPYSEVGATWDKLLPYLGKEGLLAGNVMFIGVCHDDPDVTESTKLRYDAGVTVDESFTPVRDIGVQLIAGGEYAVTTHFGPYHKLGETYTKLLGQCLPRSGRELGATPCFEIYLNDPQSTEPEDLVTDIYAPLK